MANEKTVQMNTAGEISTDPLTLMFMKKLDKYPYLDKPGFEAKKEQLRLMLLYGFTDLFIDRFFNPQHHEYINCHAEELDQIRMAAVFAGAGEGARGEKYILEKLEKEDVSMEDVLLDLSQQYVDAHIRQLPVVFKLKQELDYLRLNAQEKKNFEEEKLKELLQLRNAYAFLQQKVEDMENPQSIFSKRNADIVNQLRPVFIQAEDKMEEVIPIVLDLKDCLDAGQLAYFGRRIYYQEPIISRSKLLALQSIGLLEGIKKSLNDTHLCKEPGDDERQKYILKTLCSPALSEEQKEEFLSAAEQGLPLYALKYLGDSPLPIENMKVLKEYISKRGGIVS